MLLTSLLTLWCGCAGVPDWPVDGKADAVWVEQALEWRLHAAAGRCEETAKAVDALTLEWISESPKIVVRIQTQEWPFLKFYSGLKTPLIQALALVQMQQGETARGDVLRTMRRVVRRSSNWSYRRVRPYLRDRLPQTS